MEYFLIRSCAVTPFEPMHMDRSLYTNLMTDEAFEKLPDDIIYYYHLSAETELPEVVFRPTFMAGDGLHDIISLYDETIRWKNMQIFPDVETVQNMELIPLPQGLCSLQQRDERDIPAQSL